MPNSIQTHRLTLREIDIESDNLFDYVDWLRDVENNAFIQSARVDYSLDELRRFIQSTNNDKNALLFGLFLNIDGRFIGTIKVDPIDFKADLAWVGMMIGDPFFRGLGYGRESLQAVLEFVFWTIGIGKVFLGVNSKNIPAVSLYRRLGFQVIEYRDGGLIMKIERVAKH